MSSIMSARSQRIDRRVEVLLADGCRCLTAAYCQATKQIDSKRSLRGPELKKIQEGCQDECCNPRENVRGCLEYERERLSKHDNLEKHTRVPVEPQECTGSPVSWQSWWSEEPPLDNRGAVSHPDLPDTSAAAASSRHVPNTDATPEAATEHSQFQKAATAIPEAATKQSKIKLLLKVANSAKSKAATEHSQTAEAATTTPEAKRPRKSTPAVSQPDLPATSASASSSCHVPDTDATPEAATAIPQAKRQRKSIPTVAQPDLRNTSAIVESSCHVPDRDATPEAATEHSQISEAATPIPEAATGHSEIQKLLMLANAASPEVATEHSEIQLAKRPRKSGKGPFSYKEPQSREGITHHQPESNHTSKRLNGITPYKPELLHTS